MKRYGVSPSVRLSVGLSVPEWVYNSKPAGRFADVGRAGRRYQRRAAGECGQCHDVSVHR